MRISYVLATGFIGFAIVNGLIANGHDVIGLASSEDSGEKLRRAGARVQVGSIEDLDCLRKAARAADGAIHTAFYHKISHVPLRTRLGVFLGGAPSNIIPCFMGAAVAADRAAIETIGQSLQRSGAPRCCVRHAWNEIGAVGDRRPVVRPGLHRRAAC